jgi:integrase/recombinase XerD
MTAPVITIFVRHSSNDGKPCKYAGDELSKRCSCKKHLRWTHNGKQFRRKAGTRSWAEAEIAKRELEDQLTGRVDESRKQPNAQDIGSCVSVFIQDKEVQGVTPGVVAKYTLQLGRLREYCEASGVFTVQGINRELITGFCATWETLYPSGITRAKSREKLRSFLRYCYEAQWLERIPAVPKFKLDDIETQPLTPKEYEKLIDAVYGTIDSIRDGVELQRKVYAFLQTMRWTGLAIRDTMTLKRSAVEYDAAKDLYRVSTKRAKTGTPVSVPIPPDVAKDLLALPESGAYFFWSGEGLPQSATSNWGQRYIAPVFKAAGIVSEGNMLSHRLRDTFAVDLLEKGTPMEEVSRLLGHTSIRTTEKHYAKWSKGRQDRADSFVTAGWAKKKKARRA